MGAEIPKDQYKEDVVAAGNAGVDRLVDKREVVQLRETLRAMEEAQALLYTHPDYEANISKWDKFSNLYDSDDIYRYIYQHMREADDMYQTRLNRAFNYNYCKGIIDLYVAYLFSTDISRDTGEDEELNKEFEALYKNADLKGTSYLSFMQFVATASQVYGHVGILVDAPRKGEEDILTEADRKQAGMRPFLNVVTPMQIRDWEMDRFGRFKWVKIEVPVEEERDFRHKVDTAERRFLIWDTEGWELWKLIQIENSIPVVELIDEGQSPENLKGTVPLVIVVNEKRLKHDWFGESAIRDISDINIAIMNWCSFGDEEIANRCLNLLAMEMDNLGSIAQEISSHNVIEYQPGASPPQYLTPGETPLKMIKEWIEGGRDEIYRLAKLGGSTGLQGVREATSGIAYAYEFNECNQSLAAKAMCLEAGEIDIHKLVAKWFGKAWDGVIAYSRDFGVDDFFLELDTLLKGRTTLTSSSAIRQMEKNTTRKMFSRMSSEFRKKIEKEIDDTPVNPLGVGNFDTVEPSLVGGSGTSKQTDSSASASRTK